MLRKIKHHAYSILHLLRLAKEYKLKVLWNTEYREWARKNRKTRKSNMRSRRKYGASWNRQIGERKARLYRKNKICFWCDKYMKYKDATVDHIVPASQGRNNSITNLRLIHDSCRKERDYLIQTGVLKQQL